MRFKLAVFTVAIATSFGSGSAISQPSSDAAAKSQRYQAEVLNQTAAAIVTRDDLASHLANTHPSNPLLKLSPEARQQLFDTVTVNAAGQITSYRIADIQSELSPSEAYKVFSLFGAPYLASKINNGIVRTVLDKIIKNQKDDKLHPSVRKYYCNGGYCTYNTAFTCNSEICGLPP